MVSGSASTRYILLLLLLLARAGAAQAPASSLPPSSMADHFLRTADGLYFSADDGVHGREPWRVDLDGRCEMVVDYPPGAQGITKAAFFPCMGFVYITDTTPASSGIRVWDPATRQVRPINQAKPGIISDVGFKVSSQSAFFALATSEQLEMYRIFPDRPEGVLAATFSATSGAISSCRWDLWGENPFLFVGPVARRIVPETKSVEVVPGWRLNEPCAEQLCPIGASVLCSGKDDAHGSEIWRLDDPRGSPVLVKDINPGPASSGIPFLTPVGGWSVFQANDGVHGLEPWRSDGTPDGTFLIKDINPGVGAGDPFNFRAVGKWVYFVANDGTSGNELWRTDGTSENTAMVADLYPGATGSSPWSLEALNGKLCFCANSPVYGEEIWCTDPETGSVAMMKELWLGPNSSGVNHLNAFRGQLYFTGIHPSVGDELFVWDGDPASEPKLVVDINKPRQLPSSSPHELTVFRDRTFFFATDRQRGTELWVTDGTENGTVLVKETLDGPDDGMPQHLTVSGEHVFFTARGAAGHRKLWVSDGTPEGTRRIRIAAGNGPPTRPRELTDVCGQLFFVAHDVSYGDELWCSDGTDEGTFLVVDASPGAANTDVVRVFELGGTPYFYENRPDGSARVWRVEPQTLRSAQVVLALPPAQRGWNPNSPLVRGEACPLTDDECYLLTALHPCCASGGETKPVRVNDTTYFVANAQPYGVELWKTDGTRAGTRLVSDILPGTASSSPSNLVAIGASVYFLAEKPNGDRVLWRTEGEPATTRALYPVSRGETFPNLSAFLIADAGPDSLLAMAPKAFQIEAEQNLVFLLRQTPASNELLFIIDVFLKGAENRPSEAVRTGDGVLIVGDDGLHGRELWKWTEGNKLALVKDIMTPEP